MIRAAGCARRAYRPGSPGSTRVGPPGAPGGRRGTYDEVAALPSNLDARAGFKGSQDGKRELRIERDGDASAEADEGSRRRALQAIRAEAPRDLLDPFGLVKKQPLVPANGTPEASRGKRRQREMDLKNRLLHDRRRALMLATLRTPIETWSRRLHGR